MLFYNMPNDSSELIHGKLKEDSVYIVMNKMDKQKQPNGRILLNYRMNK